MESFRRMSRVPSARRISLTASTQSFVLQLARRPSQAILSIQHDVLDARSELRLPAIALPTVLFWVSWVVMFVLQFAVILNMLTFSIIYYRLSQPRAESVRVVYNLPRTDALRAVAVTLLLVMSMYLVNIKRMVVASLKARRPAFWRRPPTPEDTIATNDDDTSPHSKLCCFAYYCRSSLWLSYRTVFGRRGLLGIENRYFNQVLTIREGVEIVSQSYQSYRMSQLVSITNINVVACLLLVINCWSTPLVHLIIRRNISAQRVVCLVIDVALQFIWAIAIPTKIMVPFIRVFDRNTHQFPQFDPADNVFVLNWEMHSQQVLVSSVVDFLSKMIPLISIFAASRAIGGMLEERPVSFTAIVPIVPIVPGDQEKQCILATTTLFKARKPSSHRGKRSGYEKIAHVVYAFWGLVVVANLLNSSRVTKKGASTSCLVELRPWFANQYSCSLVEIDCYQAAKLNDFVTQEATNGYAERFLSQINEEAVAFVAFVHCPALRVPANLAAFSNLRGLEIYNSTIVSWDLEDASLRQHRHSILRRVSLVRTPLTQVPNALLVDDLPQSLLQLNFIATGIKSLPDIVRSQWRHVRYIALEHSPLNEVPAVLTRMPLGRLGLTNSNLTSLPDFPLAQFEQLLVGSNPLTQLPSSIGDLTTLAWLSFDHTAVASLPAWITTLGQVDGVNVYGDSTPYCHSKNPVAISCAETFFRPQGMYPLDEETERRTAALS